MTGTKIILLALLLTITGTLWLNSPSAFATVVTTPVGTPYTGTLSAKNEGKITLDGPSEFTSIACGNSTVHAQFETHGSGVTAKAKVNSLTFTECNVRSFIVIQTGSLEVHVVNGYGTVTSSGAQITVEKETIFGLLHCVLSTGSTDIGTLANPSSNSEHAVLGLEGKTIPVTSGSGLCGKEMKITGSYVITSPTGLRFDGGSDPKSTLTSPSGTTYSGSISAENEGQVTFLGGAIECGSSTFSGAVELQSSIPASGTLSSLSFAECNAGELGEAEVKTLKKGSFELLSTGSGNGTLISSGAEITINIKAFGLDCLLRTHNTDLGTFTAAPSNSGHAVLDNEASLPVTVGNELCGTSMEMEGAYKFTSPTGLRVD